MPPINGAARPGSGRSRWVACVASGHAHWSVALGYDHLFMANRDVGVVFDPVFVAALNHKERIGQDVDVVTARIDYRFGGPVTARY